MPDSRNIQAGLEIPTETYCDQPYAVRTDDDAWLCVLTTGAGREGQSGQHVVTTRSTDRGRTWPQPEIVLYDDDPYIRMSYPDLIQEGGATYLTETQKDLARVHEVDPTLLEGLWGQLAGGDAATVATEGLVLALPAGGEMSAQVPTPELPAPVCRGGRRPPAGCACAIL